MTSIEKEHFEGGSTRTVKLERFDLIPPEAEAAMARRFGLGAQRHGEGNWKHGGVEFIKATINHMKAHISDLLLSVPEHSDDENIGAILWGGAALAWFRVNKTTEFEQAMNELSNGKVEQRDGNTV